MKVKIFKYFTKNQAQNTNDNWFFIKPNCFSIFQCIHYIFFLNFICNYDSWWDCKRWYF